MSLFFQHKKPTEKEEKELLSQVKKSFNAWAEERYQTILLGGFDEPFYKAPIFSSEHILQNLGEIQFRENYLNSSLHELSHWCVAGKERRKQDDFGYWYSPDGRTQEEQKLFFELEVRPQAIEMGFCEALQIPFSVSVDNLDNPDVEGVEAFTHKVIEQWKEFTKKGFPPRAESLQKLFAAIDLV